MTLSTWQLVVVGLLLFAWIIVLGGPAVVDAFRWYNGRSRRRHARQSNPSRSPSDSGSGHRRSSRGTRNGGDTDPGGIGDRGLLRRARAAERSGTASERHSGPDWRPSRLERVRYSWSARPRPISAWRAQDVVQRRIQILLGLSLATFVSMFLAIALRGLFVRLFLLILAVVVVSLAVAAYIGAVELRHYRAQMNPDLADDRRRRSTRPSPGAQSANTPIGAPPLGDVGVESDTDVGFGSEPMVMADEGFRDPTAETGALIFEPLNLDEIVSEMGRDRHGSDWGEEMWLDPSDFDAPIDPDLARELGIEPEVESSAPDRPPTVDGTDDPAGGEEPDRSTEDDVGGQPDATFTAAPEAGARQASARARSGKRRRARPIYIESTLDDEDNQWKAANDQ